MTEPTFSTIPDYSDQGRKQRLSESLQNRPLIAVDKPVRFRVAQTRPATVQKHYKRKGRKRVSKFDPRNVQFF